MADETVRPPDQVSATGVTGAPPPPIGGGQSVSREVAQSLSGAPQQGILGMGGPGQGGEGGLIQAMMQQSAPQANPWLAAASGMQQGLAGKVGANPYLADQQRAAEQQQSQQRSQYEMLARAREQKMKQDQANEAMELEILGKLKDSSDPGAVEQYQRGMSDWARRHNVNARPEWFASKDKIPTEDLGDINNMIVAGVPDAEIFARYPKLKPTSQGPIGRGNWLDTQRAMLKDPYVREKLGYKTPDDPADAVLKKDAERASNWIKAHPDFKEGGDLLAEANARFRKLTGREITTSTKEDAAILSQVSQDARKAIDDREAKRKADERAQARADNLADRVQKGQDKPIPVPAGAAVYDRKTGDFYSYGVVSVADMKDDPKRYKTIGHTEMQLIEFLETTNPQLDLLDKITNELLAVNPGANLAKQLELAAKGKLAMSPELTAFMEANADLALEMARALSGGGQLRIQVLKYVREDVVPSTSDSVATARTKIRMMRQQLANRRKGILGESQGSYLTPKEADKAEAPKAGQTFNAQVRIRKDGKDYNLAPGSPLPQGYEVVK